MEKRIIDKMCCPFDKNDLHLTIFREEKDVVVEGIMLCTKCARYYPIISGIPIMSPDEFRELGYERPFLEKWQDHLPKQLSQNEVFRIEMRNTSKH
ncbi:Trm112 family protein [Riemerella columbina]|uniref:Trm112 family protein n=1 Tax=Riemerella columbina TaxID=103810 RepID=UPI000370AFB7|nr:Trm112 family protein [Riemerella columbina]